MPVRRLIALILILLGSIWFLARILAPAQVKVRRTFNAMVSGLETENYWRCVNLLSPDFQVPDEFVDVGEAKQGLYYLFREYDGIQIDVAIKEIRFGAGEAKASISFKVAYWPTGASDRARNAEGEAEIGFKKTLLGYRICSAAFDESVLRQF